MRQFIKKRVPKALLDKLRRLKKTHNNFFNDIKAIGYGRNLDKLAHIYETDKIKHSCTTHYQLHFKKYKSKKINLLEIGVGGYDNPNSGGNSLRMWKKYFSRGKIFSFDIYDKFALQEKRIKIFQGSQIDSAFLEEVIANIGENGVDIIIDDGSHINEHVIETFRLLFPKLNDGGIYVVEDIGTSYWKDYGGDNTTFNNSNTSMCFFKNLTDSLNYSDFSIPNYIPNYYDKKVISISFYHNMVFIYKGNNCE
jgi:demethylmacrocin O-methyltransferase